MSASAEFLALQAAVAGRYSLERELGRGGMGIVFLARDVGLERPVAIKLLPPGLASQFGIREGFLREARTAAGLSHPNIVSIHLVEQHDELVYFIMAFVGGETLAQRVHRAGPLPVGDATRLLQDVAWALAYAHGRGVIHRDVKPENILIERATSRAMVADFGIAHRAGGRAWDAAGEVIGTAHYMSPKQAAGESVDGRSDLYSLGATGFFALTGRLPFEATTVPALLAQHLTHPAPPVRTYRPGLPPRLAAAIDRCLAKEPAARFASGEELAEELGAARIGAREVPVVIQRFERAVVVMGIFAFTAAIVFTWTELMAPGVAGAVGSLFLVMWAVSALDMLSHARLVRRAGFGHADVASAFIAEARARRREGADLPQGEAGAQRAFDALPPALLPAAVLLGVTVLALSVLLPRLGVSSPTARVTLAFLGTFVVTLVARFGIPGWQRASVQGRVVGGSLGRAVFGLAGLGLRPPPQTAPAPAPTEVLLARALEALFDGLPEGDRARLADFVTVVRRLAARIQALRGSGHAERAQLAQAVTALERLRLDFLQMRAGAGSVEELAADLQAARRIAEV